jgi:hypothetical protein
MSFEYYQKYINVEKIGHDDDCLCENCIIGWLTWKKDESK